MITDPISQHRHRHDCERFHGLRAQAAELRRSSRSEAQDAADSLDRDADELTEIMFDRMVSQYVPQCAPHFSTP